MPSQLMIPLGMGPNPYRSLSLASTPSIFPQGFLPVSPPSAPPWHPLPPALSSITPSGPPPLSRSSWGGRRNPQRAVPCRNRAQGALHPLLPSSYSSGENPTCSYSAQSQEPTSSSPLRTSPSSRLFVPPTPPPLSLGFGGGHPTPRCQVLVLTCPCENGAPITATVWTDFFRTKCICVRRRRERLLLSDMMGTAGRRQAREVARRGSRLSVNAATRRGVYLPAGEPHRAAP